MELKVLLEQQVGRNDLDLVDIALAISHIPYGRPSDLSALGVVREWRGTCSTKHMLLGSVVSKAWPDQPIALWHRPYLVTPELAAGHWGERVASAVPADGLVDVHTFATMPRGGVAVTVDVTFPLESWDGRTDIPLACGPGDDHAAGDRPLVSKARLVEAFCDPSVREPFIAAIAAHA